MNQAVMEAILNRRSIRAYTSEQLTQEQVDALLQAAVYAPSAINKQPWHFTVIRDQKLLDEISRAARANAGQDPDESHVFYHAPLVILTSTCDGREANGALAVENMALAAYGMDLGSVIIGYANMAFKDHANEALKARLKLPEGYEPVLWLAVGHPAEQPEAKPRVEGTVSYLD